MPTWHVATVLSCVLVSCLFAHAHAAISANVKATFMRCTVSIAVASLVTNGHGVKGLV